MRSLLFSLCLGMCLVSRVQDPAVVNPSIVKVEWENSKVRVLRVRFRPHEKLDLHSHPAKAEVQLTDGSVWISTEGKAAEESPGKAGEFFWFEPTKHAVQNGNALMEIIEIELKMATEPGISVKKPPKSVDSGTAREPVPVENEPHHRWTFENQYVRVLDVVLSPGESTLLHTHSHDNIAVHLSNASLLTQTVGKDGELAATVMPGQVTYREGTTTPYTHRVKNAGSTVFHVFDIELLQ